MLSEKLHFPYLLFILSIAIIFIIPYCTWEEKIPPLPQINQPHIIISKSQNQLYLFHNRQTIFHAPVATGKTPELTPEGIFTIVLKMELDPVPGQKNEQLGTRWLGLNVPESECGQKYGIHGTNEPESIGHYASQGCIRLYNEDVEKLFARVETGITVIILP